MQKADKAQQFPDMLIEREKKMSQLHGRECSTFWLTALGQKMYFVSWMMDHTA